MRSHNKLMQFEDRREIADDAQHVYEGIGHEF